MHPPSNSSWACAISRWRWAAALMAALLLAAGPALALPVHRCADGCTHCQAGLAGADAPAPDC